MNNLEKLNKILLSANVVEDFHKQYTNEDFKNWLLNILPEVEDCKNQEQDNPWHKYNVLDHILHAVEEMNKQTTDLDYETRRMLAYTMFYHDIGKPACHIRRFGKTYGKMIDSFFDHNIKSEEIALRSLKIFDFDEKSVKIICKLINKHDIFMNISEFPTQNKFKKELSEELISKIIEDLNTVGNGNQLMQYLIMVGRSDNHAQNEKMTLAPLRLLDKIENMLCKINEI